MRRTIRIALLAALLGGLLGAVGSGHGGVYHGPGDTVPPGGGGGGGGAGPTGGGPPSTGGGRPGAPTPGGGAPAPGPGGGGGKAGPAVTGQPGLPEADLTSWQIWWGFNKDRYLRLRESVHGSGVVTGGDEFFLGPGMQRARPKSLAPSEAQVRGEVVPALLAALDGESDNDVVTACLVALARIGDVVEPERGSELARHMRARLKDPVQEIRETAAVSLGILGNPSAIADLVDLVDDTPRGRVLCDRAGGVDERTRAFAAYGLGLIGRRTEDAAQRALVVDRLQAVLDRPQGATRDLHVAAVIAMGLVPVAPLRAEAERPGPVEGEAPRAAASRAAQARYLLGCLREGPEERDRLVRAHVPRSLALLVEDADDALREDVLRAVLPLVGERSKAPAEVRQGATLALGRLDASGLGELAAAQRRHLVEAAGDADQQTRRFALVALAQVGGSAAAAGDQDAEAEVRRELLRQLARGGTPVRPWAALALGLLERGRIAAGETASSAVREALRATLDDARSPEVVGGVAIAVGLARDDGAAALLLEKLDTLADEDARGYCAVALGMVDARGEAAGIEAVLEESKYRAALLREAAIGLALLGEKGAVTTLVDMLENQAGSLSSQAAIATALGFIGDSGSVAPLCRMLGNGRITPKARAFAAAALGLVADPELENWNTPIGADIDYRANTPTLTDPAGAGILDLL